MVSTQDIILILEIGIPMVFFGTLAVIALTNPGWTGPDTSKWPDLYPATEPRIDPSHYGKNYNVTSTAELKKHLGIKDNSTIWATPAPPTFNPSASIQNQLLKKSNAGFILPYSSLAQEEEMREPWAWFSLA